MTDNCLYYFKSPNDKEPLGIIPLENLEVREYTDTRKNVSTCTTLHVVGHRTRCLRDLVYVHVGRLVGHRTRCLCDLVHVGRLVGYVVRTCALVVYCVVCALCVATTDRVCLMYSTALRFV